MTVKRYHPFQMDELTHRAPRDPLVPPGGIDCHIRDMTATVAADVTLPQFQSKLAEDDQWLTLMETQINRWAHWYPAIRPDPSDSVMAHGEICC